jgi:hypothetical protein
MKAQGTNLWTIQCSQKVMGVDLGTRMTLVRNDKNESLLAHSPIPLESQQIEKIAKLGEVKWIVAPNKFHHLYVTDFQNYFKNSQLYLAPGLKEKREDLKEGIDILIDKTYPWSTFLDFQIVEGAPLMNEVVFYHKASRSLIVTDLGLNIGSNSPLKTRIFAKIFLTYNQFGWSKLEEKLLIKDKRLFRESVEKIASWDFEQIILPHGNLVTKKAHEKFVQAFL